MYKSIPDSLYILGSNWLKPAKNTDNNYNSGYADRIFLLHPINNNYVEYTGPSYNSTTVDDTTIYIGFADGREITTGMWMILFGGPDGLNFSAIDIYGCTDDINTSGDGTATQLSHIDNPISSGTFYDQLFVLQKVGQSGFKKFKLVFNTSQTSLSWRGPDVSTEVKGENNDNSATIGWVGLREVKRWIYFQAFDTDDPYDVDPSDARNVQVIKTDSLSEIKAYPAIAISDPDSDGDPTWLFATTNNEVTIGKNNKATDVGLEIGVIIGTSSIVKNIFLETGNSVQAGDDEQLIEVPSTFPSSETAHFFFDEDNDNKVLLKEGSYEMAIKDIRVKVNNTVDFDDAGLIRATDRFNVAGVSFDGKFYSPGEELKKPCILYLKFGDTYFPFWWVPSEIDKNIYTGQKVIKGAFINVSS